MYSFLVNKHDGIRIRYHHYHDGSTGGKRYLSWLYLIWLNVAYYVFFCRFLGKAPNVEYYEKKRLVIENSETNLDSSAYPELSIDKYVAKLKEYDVISFDIFDTLIFRSVAQPTDVFYFVGERMDIMDFKNIRSWAEWDARMKCNAKNGHMEIGFQEIWENLSEDIGCDSQMGMQTELDFEKAICYANPFMLAVWDEIRKQNKRIIVTSDMYLPKVFLKQLLSENGFSGWEKMYVSCEYGKNKASGSLFDVVKSEYKDKRIIHVGDNPHSDVEMAKKSSLASLHYPNINRNMLLYRPYDMSYMVGSAYRALTSAHLYSGVNRFTMEYEYGYLYGGLFVLGYCHFIHEYVKNNGIDVLLFLSRDGDILKQVYDVLYPNENTKYVYWSRKAATKLTANEDKHDYFRRFIYHKINQEYTLEDIIHSMELDSLLDELDDWKSIWLKSTKKQERESKNLAIKQLNEDKKYQKDYDKTLSNIEKEYSESELEKLRKKNYIDLKPEDELTDQNGYLLRRFIEAKWDKVLEIYSNQQIAAECYYKEQLQDARSAVAIDIGWAGSGALALSHMVEKVWKLPCSITGIIAGTNTIHNAEPDATEPFLQSGKLVAYLYSQQFNRDLLKKHDPNKDYNVFWELLLSSPQQQFKGFALDEYGEVKLEFGKKDANQEGIRDIQQGILDFAQQYIRHFKDFPYMFNISGRDAYAPMLVASSYNEKYLKEIEKKFKLEINVN